MSSAALDIITVPAQLLLCSCCAAGMRAAGLAAERCGAAEEKVADSRPSAERACIAWNARALHIMTQQA